MKKLAPMMFDAPIIGPVRDENATLEVEEICRRAGIRYKLLGGNPPAVAVYTGRNARSRLPDGRKLYMIDEQWLPSDDPERSLRILEILAHGFHDLGARESVRGLFG